MLCECLDRPGLPVRKSLRGGIETAAVETTERLGRSLGFFSTFTIGTGTMIGAGIFILPGLAMANAGPASIISFLLGGLISIATAISMAELATGMPLAGGSYYYISRTMGAAFGAVIGLGSWLALIFKGTFALIRACTVFPALLSPAALFRSGCHGNPPLSNQLPGGKKQRFAAERYRAPFNGNTASVHSRSIFQDRAG